MPNIVDYVDFRADVSFENDPFNEVDNLLFSYLSYVDFSGVVPGPDRSGHKTIEQVTKEFFYLHSEEEILSLNTGTKMSCFLLRKMSYSKRYGKTKIGYYSQETDYESSTQFSAVSFFLPDGTVYVAYRGTDDSLAGWKEDFNMSFSVTTGGRIMATEYLNRLMAKNECPIRVGGHSKGGNFAVYAAAFCDKAIQDRIIKVYSNDGPGFIDEILEAEGYKAIYDRIESVIPEQSFIGIMFFNDYNSKVIKSEGEGIAQHYPDLWQIRGNRFIESETGLQDNSLRFDKIMKNWAMDVDYETRDLFCEILFSAMSASGATTLSEITASKMKSVVKIKHAVDKLDKEHQTVFYDMLKKLFVVSSGSIKESLFDWLNSALSKNSKENKSITENE